MERLRQLLQTHAGLNAAALAMAAGAHEAVPVHVMSPSRGPAGDGRHDFDFLHGHWQIRNERLRQRLAGSQDWEVFHATQVCQPLLGGLGNVDDFVSDWTRPGLDGRFLGMTLRLFRQP